MSGPWNDLYRTGYRTDGLLDVHFVTDEDIAAHTSWAVKIGAVTDAARELSLRGDSAEAPPTDSRGQAGLVFPRFDAAPP